MSDDLNQKIIDLAYSGSAESVFVIALGISLEDVFQTRAERALAAEILSRLTSDELLTNISPDEASRLRALQGLLLVASEYRQNPSKYPYPKTKH